MLCILIAAAIISLHITIVCAHPEALTLKQHDHLLQDFYLAYVQTEFRDSHGRKRNYPLQSNLTCK